MNKGEFTIRYRLKKNQKIYTCPQHCLNNGILYTNIPEKQENGKIVRISYELKPDEYEIIPQVDYHDFRNQTAKDIFCSLLSERESKGIDALIDESVEYTDKLIERLRETDL